MAHQPVDNIVFQPRIEHWYNVNKASGTLPERYAGMSLIEVYDDLGVSVRPYDFFNSCLKSVDDPNVKTEMGVDGEIHFMRVSTPVGAIETRWSVTSVSWHTEKFPLETPEDARVMEYILKGRTWEFDLDLFNENDILVGDRGAPMIFIPRVNIQRLFIDFMGVENTLYALEDDLPTVERLMSAINESDGRMLEAVAASPVVIINYGDNIDKHFLTPRTFEKYVLPEYHRRTDYLHNAGKLVYAHWDGSIKSLLPYARATRMDGIEALTPIPQGDVTIAEIKEALEDMVLLDGIPMTWFLPHENLHELERVTREVIETFAPNLILGISDELSPVCDIERVRRVAEIVRQYEDGSCSS